MSRAGWRPTWTDTDGTKTSSGNYGWNRGGTPNRGSRNNLSAQYYLRYDGAGKKDKQGRPLAQYRAKVCKNFDLKILKAVRALRDEREILRKVSHRGGSGGKKGESPWTTDIGMIARQHMQRMKQEGKKGDTKEAFRLARQTHSHLLVANKKKG